MTIPFKLVVVNNCKASSIGMAAIGIGLKAQLKAKFAVFWPKPEGFNAFSTSDYISEY